MRAGRVLAQQSQTEGGFDTVLAQLRHGKAESMDKESNNSLVINEDLVGAGRFERPTPCAQGRCATRLRYAPTGEALFILKHFLTRRTPRRGQKLPKTCPTVAKPHQLGLPCQNSGCSNSPAGSASAAPPVSSAASSENTS